jgi:hypothetical protein
MVRTGDSLSLTFQNTTSADLDVKLFRLGADDATTFTTRGAGSEAANEFIKGIVYDYNNDEFRPQVTIKLTFSNGDTTADIVIQSSTIAQVESTLAGFSGGTWSITPGTSPTDAWNWFCEEPSKTIASAIIRVSGVIGDNLTFVQVPEQLRSSSGIVVSSTPDYNFINESQTGAPIKAFSLDIETTNANQIKEVVNYSRRDVNGNEQVLNCTPTIDPYQYIGSSLLNISVTGFDLDGNTQVQYTIKANATVKLSLNYMTLRNCDLFKGALRQRLAMERIELMESTEKREKGLVRYLVAPK